MTLLNALLSTLLNLVLFGGFPFLFYWLLQRARHGRSLRDSAARTGLQIGERRYLTIAALCAALTVVALVLFPPPIARFLGPGSPYLPFLGLGFGGEALLLSLLYGVVKTGFSEELLFRGLIAGSLGRRFHLLPANLIQATIFLVPHLLILRVAPDLVGLLPVVFAGALIKGWIRIRSGSILGPVLIHAAANVTTCLSLAVRSAI